MIPLTRVVLRCRRSLIAAAGSESDLFCSRAVVVDFAPQPETERYLNHVADKFDLRRDIQLRSRVKAASFDEAAGAWAITLEGGRIYQSRYLVSGAT